MKKVLLVFCMLVAAITAQAQFEKGKWFVNPSLSGFNLSYDTKAENASFGVDAQGGKFILDNVAVLANVSLGWNVSHSDADVYALGVGGRYYLDNVGVYLGSMLNLERWDTGAKNSAKLSLGLEAGYAYFLSRTVTVEPAAYWKISGGHSRFGVKVGFGFYF